MSRALFPQGDTEDDAADDEATEDDASALDAPPMPVDDELEPASLLVEVSRDELPAPPSAAPKKTSSLLQATTRTPKSPSENKRTPDFISSR
jgi:hypothetical protein